MVAGHAHGPRNMHAGGERVMYISGAPALSGESFLHARDKNAAAMEMADPGRGFLSPGEDFFIKFLRNDF